MYALYVTKGVAQRVRACHYSSENIKAYVVSKTVKCLKIHLVGNNTKAGYVYTYMHNNKGNLLRNQ